MTQIEFEQRFMKITAQFTVKAYSQDRVALIFQEVKNISAADFEKLVNHFLGNARTAPLVADFKKAIQDLGIKRFSSSVPLPEVVQIMPEQDMEYCIRENIWADRSKIMVRGSTLRDCSVIYKKDHPDHPLVIEDSQVRSERLREVKAYLEKGMYSEYVRRKTGSVPHGTFKVYDPREGA